MNIFHLVTILLLEEYFLTSNLTSVVANLCEWLLWQSW